MDPGTDDGTDGGADPAIERVRRELAYLGRDAASAPDVPAEVTARIGAALRTAPAHGIPRPRMRRAHLIGLLVGLLAVVVGVIVAASVLLQESSSRFPAGPTAEKITVTRPAAAFPLAEPDILALLTAQPEYGPLSDTQRRASCLQGLGYPPGTPVLGARWLAGDRVVLVLPGRSPEILAVLLVEPHCNAAHSGLTADTVVRRP
ncbi:hypothetical protein ABGB19_15785 [Mycobacterium sp. B14F4]|uniref:hypothetical protein n=1 Tax=Mycobacterium sp. B14F4 TaxID=3153565 RepID=UPI00325E0A6F